MIKTFVLTFHRCLETTPDPTPPPLAWLCHERALGHVGEYIWVIHAWAPSTRVATSNDTMGVLWLLHPFVEVDVLHFVDDFHLHEGYFRWGNICFCFGSFTMSFFGWPFRYGVWIFMRLFCFRWFYKWFQPLFRGMWAHCSKSCSTFSIMFVFCILTLSVGKSV